MSSARQSFQARHAKTRRWKKSRAKRASRQMPSPSPGLARPRGINDKVMPPQTTPSNPSLPEDDD
ncbi:MAG: hypothetical protein AAF399_03195 [Bacteroidota bacterium]